jgi:hypothetical protein
MVRLEGLGKLKKVNDLIGTRIAQVVSRQFPTAAARVRSQDKSCGICGGQSDTGHDSFENFGFLCQFLSHQMLHTHLSSGAGTVGQLVSDISSGPCLTPSYETRKM